MKFQRSDVNDLMARAQYTLQSMPELQPKAIQCTTDLENFIKNHTEQEIALWLVAVNTVQERLINKLLDIVDIEVTE